MKNYYRIQSRWARQSGESIDMFDAITAEKIGYYVYALLNPETNQPFYIGKGKGNRVFEHQHAVLEGRVGPELSLKQEQIRYLLDKNLRIDHLILRFQLDEKEAYLVESTLIDAWNCFGGNLLNVVAGHHSNFSGIKTTDEIMRLYNAPPLGKLEHRVAIININKKYREHRHELNAVYKSVQQAWVISAERRQSTQYVLAEYQGVIVGVFCIYDWYEVETKDNKRNNRWGFNGEEAEYGISRLYLNKSIVHVKKRGAANPVRFTL